jgi:hypothetical protein
MANAAITINANQTVEPPLFALLSLVDLPLFSSIAGPYAKSFRDFESLIFSSSWLKSAVET